MVAVTNKNSTQIRAELAALDRQLAELREDFGQALAEGDDGDVARLDIERTRRFTQRLRLVKELEQLEELERARQAEQERQRAVTNAAVARRSAQEQAPALLEFYAALQEKRARVKAAQWELDAALRVPLPMNPDLARGTWDKLRQLGIHVPMPMDQADSKMSVEELRADAERYRRWAQEARQALVTPADAPRRRRWFS